MLKKYARSEAFLEVKTASDRIVSSYPGEAFSKFAALEDAKVEDGFLYVRARAISSRVNKNHDGWPSKELASSYRTFTGRPVFVDHNNSDPTRTRGVVIDSKLHVEDDKTSALDPYYATAPEGHKPPTWIEILIEVDAKTFPKLAKAIKNGWIDSTSMGANIDRSICSVCANEATSPDQYCDHIKKKGATFEITADNGEKIKKLAYEDCYGVVFFEDSFVFDPADVTALNIGVDTKPMVLAKTAGQFQCPNCHNQIVWGGGGAPANLKCASCGWEAQNPAMGEYDNRNGGQTEGVRTAGYSWYRCQECGNEMDNNSGFCPQCGSNKIEQTEFHNMPKQKGRRGSYDSLIKIADGYHAGCRECGGHLINVQDDTDGFLYCPKCDRTESNLSTLAPFLEHVKEAGFPKFCPECDSHNISPSQQYDHSIWECNDCGKQDYAENFRDGSGLVDTGPATSDTNYHDKLPALKHSKTADFGMGGQGVDKERVINFEPQSDMVKAPEKVDTLKDDIECPNCHTDYLTADPDGILRCPTCSYEQPPQGLDNPDLSAAQREDDQDLQGNKNQNPRDVVRAGEEDADLKPLADSPGARNDQFIEPIKPLQAATKNDVTTEEISEMIWKRKIQTDSAAEANQVLRQVIAGSIETPIEYPGGIHFGTHAAFQKHGINATVTYPGAPQPLPIPGNAMQHFMLQINAAKAQGLEGPGQLVVRVDAPDDQLDEAVNLIHTGGAPSKEGAVQLQPKKIVLKPQPDKKQEEIESDQLAPVTGDRRVIKREETPDGHRTEQIIEETGTLGIEDKEKDDSKDDKKEEDSKEGESNEDSEGSEKKDDSNLPDFLKKKEPVAASIQVTAEEEHDEKFIQEAIKHKGRLTEAVGGAPHEHLDKVRELAKKGDSLGAAARLYLNVLKPAAEEKESNVKMLNALALAEELVDSGLLPKEQKLAFVGQLENGSEEAMEVWSAALAFFKSANTTRRVAHNRTLPRLGSVTRTIPTNNGVTSVDDIPLEAVFLP